MKIKLRGKEERLVRFLAVIQIVLMGLLFIMAILNNKVIFQGDFLGVLPNQEQPELIASAENLLFNKAKNQAVISLSGKDHDDAHDQLHAQFSEKDWLIRDQSEWDVYAVARFYAQYAGLLLPDGFEEIVQDKARFSAFYLGKLNQASNPFVAETIGLDPTLISAEYVESTLSKASPLSYEKGRFFIKENGNSVFILLLDLKGKASDIEQAQQRSQEIKEIISRVSVIYPNAQINYSGMLFHTDENTQAAEFEITFFGGLSLLLVILFVFVVFKSIVPVFWVSLTILNAVLSGITALFWLFPEVHLLSLVFGVTLIGISIDYCFHVLSEGFFPDEKSDSRRVVLKTLLLGFTTTALGYLMFLFTPISMLGQVAVFVIAGLLGALAISVLVHYEPKSKPKGLSRTFGFGKGVFWRDYFKEQKGLFAFTLLVASLCLVVPFKFNDSVALLSASSDKLVSSEVKHKSWLGQLNVKRVFVEAKSVEQLLQREEALKTVIKEQFPQVNVQASSDYVPSIKRQESNLSQVKQAFINQNFEKVLRFFPDFSVQDEHYLTPHSLDIPSIKNMLESRLISVSDSWVSVVDLQGITDEQLNSVLEAGHGFAHPFNKQASLTQVLALFREKIQFWLMAAALVVVAVVAFKGGILSGLYSGMALFVSVGSSLLISQWVQGYLNIFNLLSSVLIVALAADFLLFYQVRRFCTSNILAISLSALSSMVVFGMLVFSQTPAVFGFGLSATVGIVAIYILSPLTVRGKNEVA